MNGLEHDTTDTIDFGKAFASVQIYDVENGTKPIAVLHNCKRYSLTMKPSDTYLFVLNRIDNPDSPSRGEFR